MPDRLTAKAALGLARWAWGLIVLVAAGVLAWWLLATFVGGKNAETTAKITGNRSAAAMSSASDAVNAVGSQAQTEAETGKKVKDAQDQVDAAPDVDAADAAGRSGLHNLRPDHR